MLLHTFSWTRFSPKKRRINLSMFPCIFLSHIKLLKALARPSLFSTFQNTRLFFTKFKSTAIRKKWRASSNAWIPVHEKEVEVRELALQMDTVLYRSIQTSFCCSLQTRETSSTAKNFILSMISKKNGAVCNEYKLMDGNFTFMSWIICATLVPYELHTLYAVTLRWLLAGLM